MRPNFLIIGAGKCGTTSAYAYLRAHPQVFMPARKEPTYFACPEAGGLTDERAYAALFAGAEGYRAVGEASVAYLYDAAAPARIRAALGADVRLIAFVRNPVDAAYSLWGQMVRAGGETLSFEDALAAEEGRLADPGFAEQCLGWAANYAYCARVAYARQLSRYLEHFPRRRLAVFVFEEFFRPGLPQYGDLCRFLGVDDDHRPRESVHNPAGTVRSRWLRRVYNERMAWKEPLKALIPAPWRRVAMATMHRLNQRPQPLPPLAPATRARLQARLEPEVRALERVLERDLSALWF